MHRSAGRLLVFASSELYTKSRRTREWFDRVLRENLRDGLARRVPDATVAHDRRRRLFVDADDLERAAEVARRTMGVRQVAEAVPVPEGSLDELVAAVSDLARPRVAGRTFAARVKRRGNQPWGTTDAEAAIGAALFDDSAGVDLDSPQVVVRVEAYGDRAWLVQRTWDGPGGLPLGTQERCLTLLSGGFDSTVAAWMVMARGCPTDFVHFSLDCAQSDHAAAVARELWRHWGAGTRPRLWVVDFQRVKEALLEEVPAPLRQVLLKQYMTAAADRLAARHGTDALVTGEALGQVSSQTLSNLALIDRSSERAVLRPLIGMDKQDIIAKARDLGTHDLAVRAKEVCDLAQGPVMVTADRSRLERARRRLPADLVSRALSAPRVIAVDEWVPGAPGIPVLREPPPDVVPTWVDAEGTPAHAPTGDPVVLSGPGAVVLAGRLQADGREVTVVDDAGAGSAAA